MGFCASQDQWHDMTVLDTSNACMLIVATVDGRDYCIEHVHVLFLATMLGSRQLCELITARFEYYWA
jgi:hypothetical protein